MKVRAIANGTDRSNAIGTVELECGPQGLSMTYLGVGAYAEGYAPGALTRGTRVRVPWTELLEARAEGDRLYLAVDPRLTPHHRLCLTGFSSGNVVDPRELFRQRLVIWVGAGGAAVVGMLLIALTVPLISPETGGATAIAMGALAAGALLGLGWIAELRLTRAADPDAVRMAILAELGVYFPRLMYGPLTPSPRRRTDPILLVHWLMPRTTLAFALSLATGLLATILMAQWILSGRSDERHHPRPAVASRDEAPPIPPEDESPPPTQPAAMAPVAAASPAPSAAEPAPTAAGDSVTLSGDCRCLRADSPLWREGLPRLSHLVLAQRTYKRGTKRRLAAEVAVVNNGNQPLTDVTLIVHFFEQDPPPSNQRYEVTQRTLFFEGPLVPAQAIKWSVDARGTSIEIENRNAGILVSPGADTAPTNFVAELLEANHRPVRLHGAMLLAYLDDPRARQAATDLRDALRDDEEPYLTRLLRATNEVRVCDLQVAGAGTLRTASGCVFNAGTAPADNAGVRIRALTESVSHQHPLAPPPELAAERKWHVPEALGPNSGRRFAVGWPLDAGAATAPTFEGYAGRFDLLD
ncbi:MAG: hypothetical protein JW751_25560 [Polyangiaceae bacterium]|nr:hypothetical protein [Polyangiaceae bacterium]